MENEAQINTLLESYPQLDRLIAQTLLKLNDENKLSKYREKEWTCTKEEEGGVLYTVQIEQEKNVDAI